MAAHLALETARVRPGDAGFHHRSFHQVGPVFHMRRRPGNEQLVQTIVRMIASHDDFQFSAQHGWLGELAQRRDSFMAATQREEHVVAVNPHDAGLLTRLQFQLGDRLWTRPARQDFVHGRITHRRGELPLEIRGQPFAHGRWPHGCAGCRGWFQVQRLIRPRRLRSGRCRRLRRFLAT